MLLARCGKVGFVGKKKKKKEVKCQEVTESTLGVS